MKQHIVKYVNNICFSSITEHPDRSYHPMVYRATKSFTLEPHDEVLVFMNQCAAYWFRMSLIHDVIFEDKQIKYTNEEPNQVCLFLHNHSKNARIHVEENSMLSQLVCLPEMLYKVVSISIKDLHMASKYLLNNEDVGSEDDDDDDDSDTTDGESDKLSRKVISIDMKTGEIMEEDREEEEGNQDVDDSTYDIYVG